MGHGAGLLALGLLLSRKLGLPDLIDPTITNRQLYLLPLLIGAALAVFLIISDLIFANFNGIGRFPAPAVPHFDRGSLHRQCQ